MIRRTMVAALVLALVLLGAGLPVGPTAGTPAGAQYIPGVTSFILEPPLVGPGEPVFAVGSGCPPGSTVQLHIEGQLVGQGTAGDDDGGSFEIEFAAPGEPGEYDVEMTCGDESDVQVLTVVESPCGFIIEGVPGAPVTFSAGGLVEGTSYSLIFQPMGRVVGTGTIEIDPHLFDFTIPEDATAGDHLLVIEGTGRGDVAREIECPVVVTADPVDLAAVDDPSLLPVTGSDVNGLVKAGAGLLAIGGLLLLAARRRGVAPA